MAEEILGNKNTKSRKSKKLTDKEQITESLVKCMLADNHPTRGATETSEIYEQRLKNYARNLVKNLQENTIEDHMEQARKLRVAADYIKQNDILLPDEEIEITGKAIEELMMQDGVSTKNQEEETPKEHNARLRDYARNVIRCKQENKAKDRYEYARRIIIAMNYIKAGGGLSEGDEMEIRGRIINMVSRGYDIPLQGSTWRTRKRDIVMPTVHDFERKPFHELF